MKLSAPSQGNSGGGGTDATIVVSDITTNDVTSTKHGFAPKSPADATKFLNGAATPAYAQVKDSDLATTDIVTNNVSTSKHGFVPKVPNDATQYLDGTGTWSIPTPGNTGAFTYETADQTISTGTVTAITFSSLAYSVGVTFASGSDPLTITLAGKYQVSWGVTWENGGGTVRLAELINASGATVIQIEENGPLGAFNPTCSGSREVSYAIGDKVGISVYHDTGGNLKIKNSIQASFITVRRIG